MNHSPLQDDTTSSENKDLLLPSSSGSKGVLIEEAGIDLEPTSAPLRPRVPGRLRLLLILLVAVAVLALATDGVLFLLAATHPHSHVNMPKTFPMLTITPGAVHTGQIALLHIDNFPASTHVLLTHDAQEAVQTDRNSSLVKLGANGETDVQLLIDDSWGPGFHMIVAEDTTTHYTASAVLQVLSDLPLRPPHLLVSLPGQSSGLQGPLNMGAEMQGANTLQPLVLHNTGGSWISWSATSNQPWLMTSPQQGIFRDGQSIFVAVARANLKPGDYSGAITMPSRIVCRGSYQANKYGMLYGNARVNACTQQEQNHEHNHRCI